MTVLIVCWFLFALPLLMAGSAVLGAFVYHAGHRGQSPVPSMPKFGVSGRGSANGEAPRPQRLPDV